MKHKFKEGEGMKVSESTAEERLKIRELLIKEGYEVSSLIKNKPFSLEKEGIVTYGGEFYAVQDHNIEKSYSYKEMESLILTGELPSTFSYTGEIGDIICSEGVSNLNHLYKEKNTMKEIIGYKLAKPEFKDAVRSIVHRNWFDAAWDNNLRKFGFHFNHNKESIGAQLILQKAGVLDLWFEPVYKEKEPEFKVGDIVKVSGFDNFYTSHPDLTKQYPKYIHGMPSLRIFKFVEFTSVSNCDKIITLQDNNGGVYAMGYDTQEKRNKVTKATPEEVEEFNKLKLPKINGYEGKVCGDHIVYGCANLPIAWFKDSNNRSILKIDLSSGVSIEYNDMYAIREYVKTLLVL